MTDYRALCADAEAVSLKHAGAGGPGLTLISQRSNLSGVAHRSA